ncbi:MAG: hypothetical protein KJ607_08480, partial [Bacteroidetes bacterium]|nr:hypothetical protein [Bacteroidota bacterium]
MKTSGIIRSTAIAGVMIISMMAFTQAQSFTYYNNYGTKVASAEVDYFDNDKVNYYDANGYSTGYSQTDYFNKGTTNF